jgi:hypothetical protein
MDTLGKIKTITILLIVGLVFNVGEHPRRRLVRAALTASVSVQATRSRPSSRRTSATSTRASRATAWM